MPEHCPHCQSTAIKRYGVGTEKVEVGGEPALPHRPGGPPGPGYGPQQRPGPQGLREPLPPGDLDFLVGTQMITKGHHFPQVTLVGVIAADLSLFFPEYHAGERTFQLLSQVAGRAGRGAAKGTVLIQTYQPEHYVFQTVQSQDYDELFRTGRWTAGGNWATRPLPAWPWCG